MRITHFESLSMLVWTLPSASLGTPTVIDQYSRCVVLFSNWEQRPVCVRSSLLHTSRPVVPLSIRWTMPGLPRGTSWVGHTAHVVAVASSLA